MEILVVTLAAIALLALVVGYAIHKKRKTEREFIREFEEWWSEKGKK